MKVAVAPLTAREILAGILPLHDIHTLVEVGTGDTLLQLVCSCGAKVNADDREIKALGWTMSAVKKALWNTPPLTQI